jgi:hypothetical protein
VFDQPATAAAKLWRWPGVLMPLNLPNISMPKIDAAGNKVFYLTTDPTAGNKLDLMVLDVTEGQVSQLATVGMDGQLQPRAAI